MQDLHALQQQVEFQQVRFTFLQFFEKKEEISLRINNPSLREETGAQKTKELI